VRPALVRDLVELRGWTRALLERNLKEIARRGLGTLYGAYVRHVTRSSAAGSLGDVPADRQPLTRGDRSLDCCGGHSWSNDGGIPRMVQDSESAYADAFGLQWKTFLRTQLDSYTGTPISRDRARRCLGEECWALLHRPGRTHVLEVGCGAGRFTEVLLATGACVTSVDLSAAVEANQDNFPQDDRHRILQADVRTLPFAPRQYDVVFCLGVIQHTPNPEETITSLYEQVRPGGWLVIDHYRYSLSRLTKTALLVRMVMRRMSPRAGMRSTERLVNFFLPWHRAARRNRVAQALVSRISPVLAY
jgi:2-polyprenyl-3-methyl-5-hydroxy-6-metoxy-1,4-benzoquinol methylase